MEISGYSSDALGITNRWHRRARAVAALRPLSGQRQLVVVLATQRTGSTLVCKLLSQLPDTFHSTEVLSPYIFETLRTTRSVTDLAAHIRRVAGGGGERTAVTKILYENLGRHGVRVDELHKALPDGTIWLHLWRRDVLAQYISERSAAAGDGRWHTYSDEDLPDRPKIYVDVDDFRTFRTRRIADVAAHQQAIEAATSRHAQLCYDDFGDDPWDALRAAGEPLFGRWPETTAIPIKKQTPGDYLRVVGNPGDLRPLIAQGEHLNTAFELD